MVKPFVLAELVARVTAVLRRMGRTPSTVEIGDLLIDATAGQRPLPGMRVQPRSPAREDEACAPLVVGQKSERDRGGSASLGGVRPPLEGRQVDARPVPQRVAERLRHQYAGSFPPTTPLSETRASCARNWKAGCGRAR